MHNTTGEQRIKIKQGFELNEKIIIHPICHFSCFYKINLLWAPALFIYLFILELEPLRGASTVVWCPQKMRFLANFRGVYKIKLFVKHSGHHFNGSVSHPQHGKNWFGSKPKPCANASESNKSISPLLGLAQVIIYYWEKEQNNKTIQFNFEAILLIVFVLLFYTTTCRKESIGTQQIPTQSRALF